MTHDHLSQLQSLIRSVFPLSAESMAEIADFFTFKSYKKGSQLIRPGDIATRAFVVQKGLLRIYGLFDGSEHIRNFFAEGDFFSESNSYFTGKPSLFYLEALEDCEVFEIEKQTFVGSGRINLELATMMNKIYEFNLLGLAERTYELLEGKGSDRYLQLRKSRPELFQRVPQYMIASYLNMTPEALSRIVSKSI